MTDKNSENLINLLLENGFCAYLVGGCVRDTLMGRASGDIDIASSAKPDELEHLLSQHNIKYIETGIKHGTVTAVLDKTPYEITTFRTEGIYKDNRHPENVAFVEDICLDLSRRDFTVNAIAYNEKDGLVDPFNGLEDINNKTLRAVGDPDKRFREDALRIMRGLRFASVLGFEIEKKTKSAIFRNKELLKNIAVERIFTELKKLLSGSNVENVLLDYRDVIAVVIPELKATFDFPQNTKWHLYDVYTHIVKSVAVSPEKDYIRFTLLLHDISKPECKTTDKAGQDHFKGHPVAGAEKAAEILNRLKVSRDFFNKVTKLVRIHDFHILYDKANIKHWLRELGAERTFDFIDVKIADLATHNLDYAGKELELLYSIKELTQQILDNKEPYKISDLKISGNDLVSIGYNGAQISKEMDELLSFVIENPASNEYSVLLNKAKTDSKKFSFI